MRVWKTIKLWKTHNKSFAFREEIGMERQWKYDVFQVAKWFLEKDSMTQKRLQKLCYYAEAWYFTLKGEKLTGTEFQAWVHGPVAPVIWQKYRAMYDFGLYMNDIEASTLKEYSDITDPDDIELLELVWNTYGDKSGNTLEALTHTEDPWIKARNGCKNGEVCKNAISYDDMKNYYSSIYDGDYGQ